MLMVAFSKEDNLSTESDELMSVSYKDLVASEVNSVLKALKWYSP